MKVIGIIALVLVAYFVWRFAIRGDAIVLLTQRAEPWVTASLKRIDPGTQLVIGISNNSKANSIRKITLLRSVAAELGATPPKGFHEEALTTSKKDDTEMVTFVNEFNQKKVQWVGDFPLPLNAQTELNIPVTDTSHLNGTIDFEYAAKMGRGGSISFFNVKLEDAQDAPATNSGPGT